MARPLTGRRELFRRLEENNDARVRRTNEVREMGGLEPVEPCPRQWGFDFTQRILGTEMRGYQQTAYDLIAQEARLLFAGDRTDYPNRNGTVYNQEALQRAATQYREQFETRLWANFADDLEPMPTVRMTERPMHALGLGIPDGVVSNLCGEIIVDDPMDGIYDNELRVKIKQLDGTKLESNDDFAFLLNKEN